MTPLRTLRKLPPQLDSIFINRKSHVLWVVALLLMVCGARSAAAQSATVSWATPAPIVYGTPLSGVQLDATTAVTTQVDLSSYYNVNGIGAIGTAVENGGYDDYGVGGTQFDSSLLGSTVTFNNVAYTLGPVGSPDAVSMPEKVITVPSGQYNTLVVLGSVVQNGVPGRVFTVRYADGTVAIPVLMSDWVYPKNWVTKSSTGTVTATESVAECNPSRVGGTGATDFTSVCVYAYTIPLDPTRTLQGITVPNSRQVVVLGIGLVTAPLTGDITYSPAEGTILDAGTQTLTASYSGGGSATVQLTVNPAKAVIQWATPSPITYGTPLSATQLDATATAPVSTIAVPLNQYYQVNAYFPDTTTYTVPGFDNAGQSYSSNLVGSSIVWNGIEFPLGPSRVPDAAAGSIISLPSGSFSTLSFLAAAPTSTDLLNQIFTVTYTDGTTVTDTQSISSWLKSGGYTGESVAISTAYQNTAGGKQLTAPANIYGYSITLDPTKTLQSISLPENTLQPNDQPVVFAIALTPATSTPLPPPSSDGLTYTPASGAILPVGNQVLTADFTGGGNYTSTAGATTSLVVNPAPLTVTANNESVLVGTTVPPYTATITGFVNGDTASVVTGSPSLTTSPASPTAVGTYPITAAIGTLASANYTFTSFVPGTLTITQPPPPTSFTFTLTSAAVANVAYGTPQNFTLHLAPQGGSYPGVVNLTATPSGETYSFSPATVAQNAGSTDITFTVTINKTSSKLLPANWPGSGSAIAFGLLVLPALGLRRSTRKLRGVLTCVALAALTFGALAMTGCGGDNAQASATYPITITATSGTITQSVSVTLNVH